jgi:carboxymethylenebutenolidase
MDVTIPVASGPLDGYLAVPGGAGPWPGVVVLHEALGLNEDIRSIADRFAGEGYVTVAPDLFSWSFKGRCLVSAFRDLLRGSGPAHERIDASRDWLVADERCNGRVAVIGFCMGGGFALLAAPRPGYAAASSNYGLVPKNAEAVLAGACPLVGSYGGQDRMLKGHADRLDRALTANGIAHDVKEYPEASHSFLNHHPGWMGPVNRVSGYGHRPAESEDAWSRILGFFDRHLRDDGQPPSL